MPAGRPKGKKSWRFMTLGQILDEKGCCPELILADQALDQSLPAEERRDAAKALMPYKWARLSAVEVQGEIKATSIGIEPEAIKAIESILSRKK